VVFFTNLHRFDIWRSETKKKKRFLEFLNFGCRDDFLENHNKLILSLIQLIEELTVVGVKNVVEGRRRRGKACGHGNNDGLMRCRSGGGFCKARKRRGLDR